MGDDASRSLRCSSKSPWTFRSHRVSWWDIKSATLKEPGQGLFLQASDPRFDATVRADNKEGSGWALWKVHLQGGYEEVRPLIRGVSLGNWFLLERWMAA